MGMVYHHYSHSMAVLFLYTGYTFTSAVIHRVTGGECSKRGARGALEHPDLPQCLVRGTSDHLRDVAEIFREGFTTAWCAWEHEFSIFNRYKNELHGSKWAMASIAMLVYQRVI